MDKTCFLIYITRAGSLLFRKRTYLSKDNAEEQLDGLTLTVGCFEIIRKVQWRGQWK